MDKIQQYFELRQRVSDHIKDIRAIVANYNLPYLALPAHTDKSVALNVFTACSSILNAPKELKA
jgi:hypothetical protein